MHASTRGAAVGLERVADRDCSCSALDQSAVVEVVPEEKEQSRQSVVLRTSPRLPSSSCAHLGLDSWSSALLFERNRCAPFSTGLVLTRNSSHVPSIYVVILNSSAPSGRTNVAPPSPNLLLLHHADPIPCQRNPYRDLHPRRAGPQRPIPDSRPHSPVCLSRMPVVEKSCAAAPLEGREPRGIERRDRVFDRQGQSRRYDDRSGAGALSAFWTPRT